jgi:hypothetical protein
LKRKENLVAHKASIGRIVQYYEGDGEAPMANWRNASWSGTNGTRVHPAMITRVWADTCVNLLVFFDGAGESVRTSMQHLPDAVFAENRHCTNSGWRWPE